MDISDEVTTLASQNLLQLPEELLHVLQHGSNPQLLDSLSGAALQPGLTERLLVHFHPIALDLCARWSQQNPLVASVAFARVLNTLPQLSELAQRILTGQQDQAILDLSQSGVGRNTNNLREILLAILRLLRFDNAGFARFVRPASLQNYLQHEDHSIRYLSIRVLCEYLHASDAAFQNMKAKYLNLAQLRAAWEDREIDYFFLPLWEDKRLSELRQDLLEAKHQRSHSLSNRTRVIAPSELNPSVAEVGDVLLLRSSDEPSETPTSQRLIMTPTTTSNMRMMSGRLEGPGPILLTGLAGCGKTSLVKHAAAMLNKSSKMITLHLNEQSDAKLFIGTYTTGTHPGSFRWQPGVLTTAVTEGRWVFIEDLDRAPNEIISTLLPLIEHGELLIPSRGERLHAATGFRVIATMRSTTNLDGQLATSGLQRMLGKRLWQHIPLAMPDPTELRTIIEQKYPLLASCLPMIMSVYHRLTARDQIRSATGSFQLRARPISPRELFKWTARIRAILDDTGVRSGSEIISESGFDSMFLDAYDCFVSHLADGHTRSTLATMIAEELHLDPRRQAHLLQHCRIQLRHHPASSISDEESLQVGRAQITMARKRKRTSKATSGSFALNGYTLRLLEQAAVAINQREPLLLVGETGIGKTAAIQHLAFQLGQKLEAINLSQQSESSDLLGGFKPVNVRSIAIPLKDEFDSLFGDVISRKKNAEFLARLTTSIEKGKWKMAASLWRAALATVERAASGKVNGKATSLLAVSEQRSKRRKLDSESLDDTQKKCAAFSAKLDAFERQTSGPSNAFRFAFAEGNLVKAVREGHFVLLDEINLASSDTLESLSDLLDFGKDARPFIILTEAGSVERIEAHPDFRVFAAMNPASDVGKKDLPMGLRSRFTEIYVDSPDQDTKSLESIIRAYLEQAIQSEKDKGLPTTITEIYQDIQRIANEEGVVDGSGQRPHFSLRTLTRTLAHSLDIIERCSIRRALYEGFCMCFFTSLDPPSETKVQELVRSKLFGQTPAVEAHLKKTLRAPYNAERYVEVTLDIHPPDGSGTTSKENHWLPKGPEAYQDPSNYIVTPYIARNLKNLIRASSTRKHPVLIQGPTSAGKTSMIEYLAKRSGNKCVRINNHEHTDLQEYLGTYVSTVDGRLNFQEGLLVRAVREGHWVVLDELNLAPTDVLEALNRLLDDNREIFVPETQQVIKPHPDFMLFATQNPAGPYGGRKTLSKAFRNRFVELHFDDIPVDELNVILAQRSQLPPSWCKLIVEVYRRLSRLRQEQRIFEQDSFATLRDLFRWAFRGADSVEQLAATGFMLLGEKVRKDTERQDVKEVIEQVMSQKGVKVRIDESDLYDPANCPEMHALDESSTGVVWTASMKRLFTLISHAVRNNEPTLLVGETGCGKTLGCQIMALAQRQSLHIVNAHQNTETGDLIGSQRPVRNRASEELELQHDLEASLPAAHKPDHPRLGVDGLLAEHDAQPREILDEISPEVRSRIASNRKKRKALFEWVDGSLVQAMRLGHHYLLDEISLADDSVLERMNSVLDPSRSLLLAEKGGEDALVTAGSGFQFLATMNPGGDFGKKELSPALRNRFTEIWVLPPSDTADVLLIAEAKLKPELRHLARPIVEFTKWFGEQYSSAKRSAVSIRDVLGWVDFMNNSKMSVVDSFVNGAALVFIDTLGANPSGLLAMNNTDLERERTVCLDHLERLSNLPAAKSYRLPVGFSHDASTLRLGRFAMSAINGASTQEFNFEAPTVRKNTMRLMRALQVSKPVLLEGNPGVGKTSIVMAVAKATGKPLVRMNLSEQTDLMDLFGSDAPMEGESAGNFAWRDAPFLQAMKNGHWVLLDEMNLASQSVLEGLNACLDHRGEVYISELDQIFARHPDFKLFAAQNPHHQGGGRKGLPASFVNRFTVVYADVYQQDDLELICSRLFPTYAGTDLIKQAIAFVAELDRHTGHSRNFGARGSPWEFNLRDTIRWLTLLTSQTELLPAGDARDYFDILFERRFRSESDVASLRTLFDSYFPNLVRISKSFFGLTPRTMQAGLTVLPRSSLVSHAASTHAFPGPGALSILESISLCVQQKWPVILVGVSGVGKTNVLRMLASTVGADLQTFAMNADIDATDLVGGFEQSDNARQMQAFVATLTSFCAEQAASLLCYMEEQAQSRAIRLLLSIVDEVQRATITHSTCHKVSSLLAQYAQQQSSGETHGLIGWCDRMAHATDTVEMANFEWVDGLLVKAIERGQWLVLDNANLCSSSVLDRLNSLLEPNGSLIVNEHCNEDGSPKVVKPHPNFRIFLTVDPQYGELSRAMRNRAVELFMPVSDTQKIPQSLNSIHTDSSLMNYSRLLHIANTTSSRHEDEAPIVQLAAESMSSVDLDLLPKFTAEVNAGLAGNGARTVFNDFAWGYQRSLSLDPSFRQNIIQIYAPTAKQLQAPEQFALHQPMQPLTNAPLTHYSLTGNSLPNLVEIGSRRNIFVKLIEMSKALDSARNTTSGPSHAMTRLSRSFASDSVQNASKDPTSRVGPFLVKVFSALLEWHSTSREKLILGQADDGLATRHVESTIRLWWALHDLTNVTRLDNAHFHTFLSLYSEHLNRMTFSNGLDQNLLNSLQTEKISLFGTGALTTGLSMEIIWELFRPAVPSSFERLEAFQRLRCLADEFGASAWATRTPVQSQSSLRKMFAQAFKAVIEDDVDITPLVQDLERELDQIKVRQRSIEPTKPYLQPVFEGICRRIDLQRSPAVPNQIRIDELEILACRNASSRSCNTLESLPGSLASLSAFNGTDIVVDHPLLSADTMHHLLLDKLDRISEVDLEKLELFQTELSVIGQHISRNATQIIEDIMPVVFDRLREQTQSLLKIHNVDSSLPTIIEQQEYEFNVAPSTLSDVFESLRDKPRLIREKLSDVMGDTIELPTHLKATPGESSYWTGVCLVSFASACLWLYVPNKPFDPALRGQMRRSMHLNHVHQLTSRIGHLETLKSITEVSLGEQLRQRQCQDELNCLGEAPRSTKFARPLSSRLDELQVDFDNVLRVVMQIDTARKGDAWNPTTGRAPEVSLLDTLTSLANRLQTRYEDYADIITPAVYFLRCLRTALVLIMRGLIPSSSSLRKSTFDEGELSVIPLCGLAISDVKRAQSAQHHATQGSFGLRCMKLNASIQPYSTWSRASLSTLQQEFDRLHGYWQTTLQKDQKANASATSMYHFKGDQPEDAEYLEQEFEEMFPSFDSSPQADNTMKDNWDPRAAASGAAESHMAIFLSPREPEAILQALMKEATLSVAQQVRAQSHDPSSFPSHQDSGAKRSIPALFLVMQEKQEALQSVVKPSKNYDIYRDANIAEAKKLVNLVHLIQHQFQDLVEAWPEHATLHAVLEICNNTLSCAHNEPLMKLMPKVEQLQATMSEWQSVASREYSAAELLSRVTETIISWRQLELTTWANLLDLEDIKCAENAKGFWFLAYGIVNASDIGNHTTELLSTLQGLLTQSTLGQYSHRLRMLRSLANQLSVTRSESQFSGPVAQAIANFCDYYARFETPVSEAIAKNRQALEKSLKEVLQLASWRDRNIEALKQSAKTSHRKLFRIVRKYRDTLGQPVASILAQELSPPSTASQPIVAHMRSTPHENALDRCLAFGDLWQSRPNRFKNTGATASLIERKLRIGEGEKSSLERLNDFVDTLEASITHLQHATPPSLTDENAPSVKHLTVRKRRLFADTLKDLRGMGLKSNPSARILSEQHSLPTVLASLANCAKDGSSREATGYLHLVLDKMDAVRHAATERHEDLSVNDASRSIGFAESLLSACLQHQRTISEHERAAASLSALIDQVKGLWHSDRGEQVKKAESTDLAQSSVLRIKLPWMPTILRVGANVLSAQSALGDLDFGDLITGLREKANSLDQLKDRMPLREATPHGLLSSAESHWTVETHLCLDSVTRLLEEAPASCPQAKVVVDHLIYWVSCTVASSGDSIANGIEDISSDDFEDGQRKSLDMILGSVQDVEAALQEFQSDVDNEGWLANDLQINMKATRAFQVGLVSESLSFILSQLHSLDSGDRFEHSSIALMTGCASLSVSLPILEAYQVGFQQTLQHYAALHRSTCRAAYRLTKSFIQLASQGFCKPAEQSNEKGGGTEKLESGTGLGEGEGAEDISKEIGDDEDMDELAQDENNKTHEGDKENQDDSVNIENALEGTAGEDIDGQDEEQGGKEEKRQEGDDDEDAASETGSAGGGEGGEAEEGEEAAENEVGDVDDLGPSTVDQKMWDRAGDEDKQEKKGTQPSQPSGADDEAASSEKVEKVKKEKTEQNVEEDGTIDDDGDEDSGSDQDAEVQAGEEEAMDPHIKESEGLDLPDEMQLDGDKSKEDQSGDLSEDDHIDDVDNVDDGDRQAETGSDLDEDEDMEEEEGEQQGEKTEVEDEEGSERDDEAPEENALDQGKDQTYGEQSATHAQTEPGAGTNDGSATKTKEEDQAADTSNEQGAGPEDSNENQQTSTSAAQRESGERSQSARTAQASNSEQGRAQPEPSTSESKDQQMIKKLGDVFEKWHRQRREIKPADLDQQRQPENQQQQDTDMANAEFEHLPDDEAEADTQALGASTQEQAKALDESTATNGRDQGQEQTRDQFQPKDMESEGDDDDVEMADDLDERPEQSTAQDQQEARKAQAFVGEHKDPPPSLDQQLPDSDQEMRSRTPSPPLSIDNEDLNAISLTTRPSSPLDPTALWHLYTTITHTLSLTLTEQLRLILAPTLATKLRGDHRTGKRLNIRRIIPYIASGYKRDRIWMRRSVPSKRAYQVMLAIDDSGSMGETVDVSSSTSERGKDGEAGRQTATRADLAFSTLALLTTSLTSLEVGSISVLGFGAEPFTAHPFSTPFTSASGPDILRQFTFQQRQTDVRKLLQSALTQFGEARMTLQSGGEELWQLMLIVGDGIFEGHEGVRREVVRCREERILVVFVVVDQGGDSSPDTSFTGGGNAKGKEKQKEQSILELESVEFMSETNEHGTEGMPKVVRRKYLDTFPFQYYLIVRDVRELPGVLATALRQWFAEVTEQR